MTRPPRARSRDEGSALIMVMGAMTVAVLMVSVALSYAMQTSGTAQHATAWNQAFAAAEAGVDDFLARLNKDDNYWQDTPAKGHVHLGDVHWDARWDCANDALQRAFDVPHAPCGWGAGTEPGWAPVNGSPTSRFHYDVDVSSTPVNGTIGLVSTGRVGTVTRTIQVTLRRGGFGEFLYATTYETTDPADYADPVAKYAQCAKYYWAGRRGCEDITFIGGDKLNGPVHSNDSILMTDGSGTSPKGPWFTGTVTTSDPSCKPVQGVPRDPKYCFRNGNSTGTASPRFDKGIAYRSEVDLPESTGDLRQYVAAPDPMPPGWSTAGCLYTGATRIQFKQTATGAGTMKVWSPGSTGANVGAPGCGDPSKPWPQDNLTVPPNGLIYVQSTPTAQTFPAAGACAPGVFGTVSGGASLPSATDYNQTLAAADCRLGTAYVDGTLKGRVTVSAQNDIVITGNLTYQGGENGTDALGLIADNSVQIYHPVSSVEHCTTQTTWDRSTRKWVTTKTCTYTRGTSNLPGSITNPVVNASILTLNHSFEVQQFDVGGNGCVPGPSCLGKLRVFGSIAQKFRGAVGRGSAGYLKDYNYDSRLRYAPPPYFLDPVRSSWGQKTFGEIAPLYGG
ncbi:pilus assembly PilX N-terminal domain-containing protein [Nocardioides aquiterrae]|uniref:Flp pilus-assembly TadG-like N-terminal domain-containing protein n=1 Tax=Nocardioides aquiterrae TaxID=203799 RepID=A0ABP4F556_9ACTN